MVNFLLVALYFFSIFMIATGIWAIISSILSKDKSMGMGAFLGAVAILIGVILFAISDTPKWNDATNLSKNNTRSYNDKIAPLAPSIQGND